MSTGFAARPQQSAARRPSRRRAERSSGATRRTLLALLAAALGIVPLKGLFSDNAWLIDVWISMLVVVGPAALIRLRRPPGALDIWPGIALLVPWITLRFLHDGALLGVIPSGDTITRLSQLMSELHETTREEVAPIQTTVPVRLVLCALVGLLAALVDLIAVVGRRGALAGVPLLVVFTVSGAVPRTPVAWYLFAIAAVGFLLLLALDAADDLSHWGRRIHGSADARGAPVARTALAVSTPRIAAAALVAAVLLPLLVPGEPRNLLANAFHGGNGGDSGSFGGAGGNGGSISPFAALKGQLDQDNPRKLAEVQMTDTGSVAPYYLKVNILSSYTARGWRVAPHGETESIAGSQFPVPGGVTPDTAGLEARIDVSGMRGNPPVFSTPTSVDGVDGDTTWSQQDGLLLGSTIGEGDTITQRFEQPNPSVEQLSGASNAIDPAVRSQTAFPTLPTYVTNLVADQIRGKDTQYAKARAISDYFADPSFTYNLNTKEGDSGSDLVDFLQNKQGYCQQYAAAMAIMLRAAGIPARVALGYLHAPPDRDGKFSISTDNAHSWVEAWFDGIGWIPFDPTPSSGLAGGGSNLAWAPRDREAAEPSATAAPSTSAPSTTAPSSTAAPSTSAAPAADADNGSGSFPLFGWVAGGGLVVVLLALAPAGVRWSRRRQRFLAARRDGDADVLWDELSDSAVDLGYVWSSSRSPRQVATWLATDAPGSVDALQRLAGAVEHRRYAAAGRGPDGATAAPTGDLVEALRGVTDELRNTRSGRARLRARFWPSSLRWTTRLFGQGRRRL